jgi:hypothetical protein
LGAKDETSVMCLMIGIETCGWTPTSGVAVRSWEHAITIPTTASITNSYTNLEGKGVAQLGNGRIPPEFLLDFGLQG